MTILPSLINLLHLLYRSEDRRLVVKPELIANLAAAHAQGVKLFCSLDVRGFILLEVSIPRLVRCFATVSHDIRN